MVRLIAEARWQLPGLGARGPVPELAHRLRLFGQFVGDWEIFPPRTDWKGTKPPDPSGEAHFRWILGGTAIQDVWGPLDYRTGRFVPRGTTIRFYDPKARFWRSTWLTPYGRTVQQFVGRQESAEIVLREQDVGWRGEHWIFSEIRKGSFRWRAESRSTPHGRWKVTEEYLIQRKNPERESRPKYG
jgi:hypothetical protein